MGSEENEDLEKGQRQTEGSTAMGQRKTKRERGRQAREHLGEKELEGQRVKKEGSNWDGKQCFYMPHLVHYLHLAAGDGISCC